MRILRYRRQETRHSLLESVEESHDRLRRRSFRVLFFYEAFPYHSSMHCPRCKSEDTAVIDSRLTEEGRAVRRRRECAACDHRFTTFERQELSSLIVVKRDGTREPYSRSKLERGIWIACTKRPVSRKDINDMLNSLEETWGSSVGEVSSSSIGQDVMSALARID